uniref:Uncharacterized protein n=1 Tax=Cyanoderma ruficeps TaxID=181631 RepID=A0A8C3QEW9_9PASS
IGRTPSQPHTHPCPHHKPHDDPNQLAPHLPIVRDGNPTKSMTSFCFKNISHSVIGAQHHGVCDESLLVFLKGSRSSSQAEWHCQARQERGTCLQVTAATHMGLQPPSLATCSPTG